MKNKTAKELANKKLKELSQVKPIDKDVHMDYSYTGIMDFIDVNGEIWKSFH
ncbi:hypothetical protein [Microaerobacter geothermalis]|uniref:hypothetical protein n=1 Tax=Microaerobacter geothermalis TaxID=674972 RepID=UPI001F4691D5|nr:hypothetical protein [Microaerobacter geothermalis]